jgi:hypothetical protein
MYVTLVLLTHASQGRCLAELLSLLLIGFLIRSALHRLRLLLVPRGSVVARRPHQDPAQRRLARFVRAFCRCCCSVVLSVCRSPTDYNLAIQVCKAYCLWLSLLTRLRCSLAQYVLNCGQDVAGSCYGGSATGAFQFVQENGVPQDTCLQYQADDFDCTPINTCRNCKGPPGQGTCWSVNNALSPLFSAPTTQSRSLNHLTRLLQGPAELHPLLRRP